MCSLKYSTAKVIAAPRAAAVINKRKKFRIHEFLKAARETVIRAICVANQTGPDELLIMVSSEHA